MANDSKPVKIKGRVLVTFYEGAFPAKVTVTDSRGDVVDDFFTTEESARDIVGWARVLRAGKIG